MSYLFTYSVLYTSRRRIKRFLNQRKKVICTMYRNNVLLSGNHCGSGKSVMRFVCITAIRVTVSNIQILSVAQKCYYGEFMSPEK